MRLIFGHERSALTFLLLAFRAIAASLQDVASDAGSGRGASHGLEGLTEDEMLAMYVRLTYAPEV